MPAGWWSVLWSSSVSVSAIDGCVLRVCCVRANDVGEARHPEQPVEAGGRPETGGRGWRLEP